MIDFFKKNKTKVLVIGAFIVGVIVLLTLSFGEPVFNLN